MAYYKAKVINGSLNLRQSASTSAKKLASIPEGTVLIVNDNYSSAKVWAHTYYGKNAGYVMTEFLEQTGSAEFWEYLFGTKNLYDGCSDSYYVRNLQHYLNLHGANIAEDGSFGTGTDTALRDFQAQNGLGVDGIAGPATKAALVVSPD